MLMEKLVTYYPEVVPGSEKERQKGVEGGGSLGIFQTRASSIVSCASVLLTILYNLNLPHVVSTSL